MTSPDTVASGRGGLAGLQGLDAEVLVLFPEDGVLAADRLPLDVVGPEVERAPVNADQQALDGGDRDGDQLAGPAGAAPARLYRQQEQGHE